MRFLHSTEIHQFTHVFPFQLHLFLILSLLSGIIPLPPLPQACLTSPLRLLWWRLPGAPTRGRHVHRWVLHRQGPELWVLAGWYPHPYYCYSYLTEVPWPYRHYHLLLLLVMVIMCTGRAQVVSVAGLISMTLLSLFLPYWSDVAL